MIRDRRRSLHFVPGGNEKMIAKALTLPADGLILDLEDAVSPDRKTATRPIVRTWLEKLDFGGRERWIRMNPLVTGFGRADLEETIAGRPDGYVVPKPRSAADIREVAQLLDGLEYRHGIPHGTTRLTIIATETPEGLLNIKDVATATPRTVAISCRHARPRTFPSISSCRVGQYGAGSRMRSNPPDRQRAMRVHQARRSAGCPSPAYCLSRISAQ